jgi:hypothetical protein
MNSVLRLFGVFAFILLYAAPALAQHKHSEAFEEGIILADFHSSIGMYKNRNFVTQRMPVFLGVDYGVSSVFSAGIFGGWNQRTFKDPKYPAYDVNYYFYGGRFSAHMTEFLRKKTVLKFNPRTVDIYATLWGGRQLAKQITFAGSGYLDSGTTSIIGGFVGVRMYSMYRIGVMVEIGAGPYGIINVGICSKF